MNDNPQYSTVMLMYDKNYLVSQGFITDDNNFNVLCNSLKAEIVIHDEEGNSHSVINRLDNLKQDWQAAKDKGYEKVLLNNTIGNSPVVLFCLKSIEKSKLYISISIGITKGKW